MNKKPSISVLMPAYNAEKYIGEAIYSILNQTFTDFELIIVNDGSVDSTIAVVKTFDDPRIILLNELHQGIAASLNKGIHVAKADYIARFDADDICMPERLQKQYDFLFTNAHYSIIGCAADYIDMNDEYVFCYCPPAITNDEIRKIVLTQCPFIHSGVLFKKNIIINAGGYDLNAHTFEDHLLWSNVLKKHQGYNLTDKLIKVRLNPQSVTIDEAWRGKLFRRIKYNSLQRGYTTEKEGLELNKILHEQDIQKIKEGSYHALLAKKYLWDNYQPGKARLNARKTLKLNPRNPENYVLWFLSFIPNRLIQKYIAGSNMLNKINAHK